MIKLEISLDSAAARAPTILKWEVVFPAQLLELEGSGPEIGVAAMDSGKSLTCVGGNPYSYTCILSGGKNPVANGPIAIFYFKIRHTASTGTATVRIKKAEAVTLDSK
jgi:hypothetical protein